jgi:predicted nucleic acid-binding protein
LLTTAAVSAPHGLPVLSNEAASAEHDALLKDDRIAFRADEPAGFEDQWRRFAATGAAAPKLWMDAYLAAFAVSAGARLTTTDAGFRHFSGLRRPLVLA